DSAECGDRAAGRVAHAVGVCDRRGVALSRVDFPAAVGPAMRAAAAVGIWLAVATPASAGDKYALVITGASGGEAYAQKYDAWRTFFVDLLRQKLAYPDDHVIALAEQEGTGVARATRENVQQALGDLRKTLTKEDQLLVVLIGHGTAADGPAGEDATFNL